MKKVSLFILALVIVCTGLHAQSRITGGFYIRICEAPWQVLLSVDGQYLCGGSIIAPNVILTAKHCLLEGWWDKEFRTVCHPSSVKVHAGITCKREVDASNTYNVSKIILHPDPDVDAALLILSSNLTYDDDKQPVNYLASVDTTLYDEGDTARVSGWGWLTPNGFDPASCLNAVDVNIITNQQASNMLGKDLAAHEIATTGIGEVRQGVCYGDSGGPLTILTTNNEPVLIGIVSWGKADCLGDNQDSPSVFVRVSYIVNWIKMKTGDCTPASTIHFTNQTVTTDTTITNCGRINVRNVNVQNGAKLIFEAAGKVHINSSFEVELGSELEIK